MIRNRPLEVLEIGGLILALVGAVCFSVGMVAIAIHFITKYW